jgi:hypothetical protein
MDNRIGRFLLSAAVMTLAALLPAVARGDNTACAGSWPLVPDGDAQQGTFTAASQARWFRFAVRPNRSYAVLLEHGSPFDVQPQICSTGRIAGSCLSGPTPSFVDRSIQEPAESTTNIVTRFGYKAISATDVFFSANQCGGGTTPQDFRVRVVETTLTSPLFTTFNGFETFYRFNNPTNQNVSVTLTLIDDSGVQVASTTFTVNANSTAATRNTGPTDLNLADNTAGQAYITYDGLPGAIQVDGFSGNFSVNPPIVLPIKIVPARQQR